LIHSLITGNGKEVLGSEIETELLEWAVLPNLGEIVTHGQILKAEVAGILNVNIRNGLPVWTGDVEEPTIMFEGDPRG
jgi:hypothetical protein